MADRVALYLQDAHDIREGIEICQYAESRGFEAVWQAESRLVRDAIVPMAAFAATTEQLKIGSGVINNWTRNAAIIAATFLTLDDLAPDRIMLGIGAWWDPLARKVGIQRERPLTAMREVVENVRKLLAQRARQLRWGVCPLRRHPAGRGARAQGAAQRADLHRRDGTADDGTDWAKSPTGRCSTTSCRRATTSRRWQRLDAGAKKVGKRAEDLDRPQLVVCSLDEDRDKALNNARKLVTQYLGQQPHIMKASGVSQELLDEINQVLTWPATEEEIERAMELVPDDVVQMITASGTADECRAKVREYVEAGATCPVLYPLGDDVHAMIDAFSEGYGA